LVAVFAFSFVVAIGAVVSPGPVSAAILSEAPRRGWLVGPLIAGGHSFLELIIVLFLTIGLSTWLTNENVLRITALGGGVLLLFMGGSYVYGAWRGRIRLPVESEEPKARSLSALFLIGILATISNPFWYAWWVTVAAGYLGQAKRLGLIAVLVFYLGHISADFMWDTFLAGTASAGRRWLTPSRYKWLIVLTGGFMIYLGSVFIRSGL
jgi:threonine/homoserine/homoserine lactone efflux protein